VVITGKTDLPVIDAAKDQTQLVYTVGIASWTKGAVVKMEIFGDAKAPFCSATFVKGILSGASINCPLFGDPKADTTRQAKPVATVIQGGALDTSVKGETK
jgi:hypothetical protein